MQYVERVGMRFPFSVYTALKKKPPSLVTAASGDGDCHGLRVHSTSKIFSFIFVSYKTICRKKEASRKKGEGGKQNSIPHECIFSLGNGRAFPKVERGERENKFAADVQR